MAVLSLLFPAFSPLVPAAAEAKVDEKGEGIVWEMEVVESPGRTVWSKVAFFGREDWRTKNGDLGA